MNLPSGIVTFLFTDIVGSTKLWQEHPQQMPMVLARHDALLRQAIAQNQGFVVKTAGDAFMAVFASAQTGMAAALIAQRLLCTEPWPEEMSIQVRMGLHQGTAQERDNDYYGHEVNRVARIQGVVHAQQIVVSQSVYAQGMECLPEGATLLDLGLHQLKDLHEPERLWQLCHPDLPAAFPPLNSLTYWPNNLPRQLSSFIGREAQIAEAERLLKRGACLSLVGSRGCGKTRLALQIAAEVLPDYPQGVWLVELAALTDPSLLAQKVAATIGLREEAGRTLTQTLVEHCRTRTLLLVLDNCEHLITACAHLTDTLLRSCSQIKMLITSREALTIAGEQIYRVPSLSLPDPDSRQLHTAETLRQYEACRLFLARADAVKADFAITDQHAPALAQLCTHLDGIPLAIELAAARVRALSLQDINARLDNRFRLLTGGDRTALPRQQTLRALIDWSYDMLSEAEKALLQHLSVFAGGWTLAAAEAVCAGEGVEDWEIMDLLTSLVDKSLVLAEERDVILRYRLLETVHQYGKEKLAESGATTQFRKQHRDWYAAFAEEVRPQLEGAEQAHGLDALEREHDNLGQALNFSLEQPGEIALGVQLAAAILRFWEVRGYYVEGRKHCAALLAHPEAQKPTELCALILRGAGSLAWNQGDFEAARSLHEQSLAMSRTLGNSKAVGASLNNLGILVYNQGDYARARSLLEESLAIYRERNERPGIVAALNNLGNVAWSEGDFMQAQALHEESLALNREHADRQGIARSLSNLGNIAKDRGNYAEGRAFQEEALALHQEIGDKRAIGQTFNNLGTLAQIQEDHVEARSLHEESLALRKELGDRHGIAMSLDNLANVASAEGDYVEARALQEESLLIRKEIGDRVGVATSLINLGHTALHRQTADIAGSLYGESLKIMQELGNKAGVVEALEAFASLLSRENHTLRSLRLRGAAERLREEIGAAQSPAAAQNSAREVAALRQKSGEEAFAAAWSEGRQMAQEQAITEALSE